MASTNAPAKSMPVRPLGTKLRIVVADDNARILVVLVSVLASDFEIIATAIDGRSVLNHIQQLKPSVAVLDLNMPGLNGIEIIGEMRRLQLTPSVVICSVEGDPDVIEAVRQAGALGYVLKRKVSRDLVPAVKCAARAESFVSPF